MRKLPAVIVACALAGLAYGGVTQYPGLVTSTASGLAPASGGGTANYLRADGTWATPSGTGVGTTGSPANGNLTMFSGAGTITNGNLSGDCTTSNTLALTCTLPLAHLATQTADTAVVNATGSSAAPTAVAIGSCSAGTSALTYNTTTHAFGCNSISGGASVCTGTANAIQYNNAGALGCAPAIVNSSVWDFTGTTWQVIGLTVFAFPGTTNYSMGLNGATLPSWTSGTYNFCEGPGDSFVATNGACGHLTSGSNNIALGFDTGDSITSSPANILIGDHAGDNITTGSGLNVCIGELACQYETSGAGDVAIGPNALGVTGGSPSAQNNNTAVGNSALGKLQVADNNVAIGTESGASLTTGQQNVLIGFAVANRGTTKLITGSRNIILEAGNGYSATCGPSSSSVNDEFDLCGNSTSDTLPIVRANIASLAAGNWKFNVPDASPGYTVATLPAAPPTGSRAYVTDAVACTFLATPTGSGSTFCPVIYNGSAWLAS